ncbi:MAG: hypothetical protein ACTSPY_13985 [Candidatus Helarchaeota archaeon]
MENIISELQKTNPSIGAVTVYNWQQNQILYQSSEWDISQDLGPILTAWTETQPSVMVQGIKYSTLQCTPERLVCQNLQGQGAIVGANYQNRLIIISWVSADGAPGDAYRDITRTLDKIKNAGF